MWSHPPARRLEVHEAHTARLSHRTACSFVIKCYNFVHFCNSLKKYDLCFGIFYEKLGDKKKYLSNHDIKTQEQPVVRASPLISTLSNQLKDVNNAFQLCVL